ncbi:hypothetical protein HK101_003862, partial [Irineochytrium annulatum]
PAPTPAPYDDIDFISPQSPPPQYQSYNNASTAIVVPPYASAPPHSTDLSSPTPAAPASNPPAHHALISRIPWQPIFQRLPGVWLISIFLFGLFGPAHVPYIFGTYLLILHLCLVYANMRSAWGIYVARKKSAEHSRTDFLEMYCAKTGSVDGMDLRHDVPMDGVCHVVVLPNYKEGLETLCDTLDVLASHPRASTNYKICLAMEESEAGAQDKAMTLIKLYAAHFYDIVYTLHPVGREGEVRGKGSNVSWAARQMARLSKEPKFEVLTIMDSDTAFAADYFNAVAYHFATATPEQRRVAMFCPTTVFDRNSKDVPAIVRITDTMWSIGVMSNLYPSSPVSFPCSAYSISLELAVAVGFWDVGPEALGEDMHMYLKCFFATEGRVHMTTIYSPASCCNIEGEGIFGGLRSRYGQAKRHLWGGLDFGFALRRAVQGILGPAEGPVVRPHDPKGKKRSDDASQGFSLAKLAVLFQRMLEAHIIMGHLVLLLILTSLLVPAGPNPGSLATAYWEAVTRTGVHPYVLWCLEAAGWLRFSTVFPLLFTIRNYELYHEWVAVTRWDLSALGSRQPTSTHGRVQPLGRRSQLLTRRTRWNLLDWFLLPVCGFLYQALPQFHAQITQLWTDRLDYVVAAKPALMVNPALEAVARLLEQQQSKSEQVEIEVEMRVPGSPASTLVNDDRRADVDGGLESVVVERWGLEEKAISGRGDSGFFEMDEETVLAVGGAIPPAAAPQVSRKRVDVVMERVGGGRRERILPVVIGGEVHVFEDGKRV